MNKANVPTKLRTKETWDRYQNEPRRNSDKCFICEDTAELENEGLQHWTVLNNTYPYDAVAVDHKMLVPFRHVSSLFDLNMDEFEELKFLWHELNNAGYFDMAGFNFSAAQTHPSHLHIHLFKWERI